MCAARGQAQGCVLASLALPLAAPQYGVAAAQLAENMQAV